MCRSLLVVLAVPVLATLALAEQPIIGARPAGRPVRSVPVARSAPSDVRPAPAALKQEIRSILARREFAHSQAGIQEWIGRRILRGIQRLLGRIFGAGAAMSETPRVVAVLFTIAVAVLFLLLLAHVAARLGGKGLLGRRGPGLEEAYAGPDSPRRALEEAARLAAAGNFRAALRLAYLAALLKLDEYELIRFDRTGTNWEYLAALSKHPTLYDALRPVTLAFDRKWYGHEPADQHDYSAFVEAYRTVEAYEVAG